MGLTQELVDKIKTSMDINDQRQNKEIRNALQTVLDSGSSNTSKKIYKALLSQSGVGAPTAIVLENTFDSVPVWTYSAIGSYNVELTGEFADTNNVVFTSGIKITDYVIGMEIQDNDNVIINTMDVSDQSNYDDALDLTPITIEVYQ